MGAGLVTLAVPSGLEAVVAPQSAETMTALLEENATGGIAEGVAGHLIDLVAERTAALLGPGIPGDAETDRALKQFLEKCTQPLVIDADGLNLLARLKMKPGKLAAGLVVVTPHPGEMARLTGISTEKIQSNRVGVARDYAQEHGVICVLKGAGTVVADPDGNAYLCPAGNPALASGGTGDVLAGMIGGLLVQDGITPVEAAATGVLLHGLAADRLGGRTAEASLLASELAGEIPALLADIHEELHHHHGPEGPDAE